MFAILSVVMLVVTLYCVGIGSPTGDVLQRAAPDTLDAARAGISAHLAPWVWDALAAGLLAQPAWTVPAGLAVVFALVASFPGFRLTARRRLPASATRAMNRTRGDAQ